MLHGHILQPLDESHNFLLQDNLLLHINSIAFESVDEVFCMLYMTIGLQASGKSTYVEKHAPKDAVIIAPDRIRKEIFHVDYDPAVEEGVWSTFFRQLELALRANKTVVVDNTNVTRTARATIISIAKRYNVPVIGYWFKVPIEECLLRNGQRDRKVPEAMIYQMQRMYDEPQVEEGFQELKEINFLPDVVPAKQVTSTKRPKTRKRKK